ncbi:S9 family peptidase [Parasphingopyxis algicola]|uniref:prolyl oligopeptidase family serine peptidase n=1 Tax=Parasphingopyxis algicola TaxID=2026624 RepID=UPI0015A2316E|nr:S9 family peptidase [Parasphingopyxis algicola]
MSSTRLLLPLLAIAAPAMAFAQESAPMETPLDYPETARGDVVEEQFGVAVVDPYRWLENDVRNDTAVRDWVTAQNAVTDAYLETLPGRDAIAARLTELWNYERVGIPEKRGNRYFYTRNDGLQNQSVLYMRDGLDGEPRLLIDPNEWSDDDATAMAQWVPSPSGRYIAYGVQDGGTDWRTIRVLDVESGETLADTVEWAKFTNISWVEGGAGFFYSRFPAPDAEGEFQSLNMNQAVYYHAIGTAQTEDRLVYATQDRPALNHFAEVTDDKRWLLIYSSEGTDDRYEVVLGDLSADDVPTRTIVPGFEHNWELAGSDGDRLYFVTNSEAPRERIVRMDVSGDSPVVTEIVAEGEATLEGASLVGDRLIANYLVDARNEARVFDREGNRVATVELPGIGSTDGFGGELGDPETFFSFTSFATPTAIYRYDSATGEVSPFAVPDVPFNSEDYTVAQRFYTSRDGTRVPMFIVHRADIDHSDPRPTLLYGYGGFNISITPAFSPGRLQWMEMGGIFALANLRGGGEYGAEWHDAGRLQNKQNVFDDMIAAGEYLIAEGITSADQLAVQGRSNGGLLVGAVVNQRPDLFAVGLPAVGVMDMLRFDRFTAGRYWVDDYGYPNREEDFRTLYAYSPYHNIPETGDFPAIMVTTADTDDRVVPGHSFKYTAALQHADLGDRPHLIRIETRAGHGSGRPTSQLIAEYADLWAFTARWTGLDVPGDE